MSVADLTNLTADDIHHPGPGDMARGGRCCFLCGSPLSRIFIFQHGYHKDGTVSFSLHIECAEALSLRLAREAGNARLIRKGPIYDPGIVGIVPSLRMR